MYMDCSGEHDIYHKIDNEEVTHIEINIAQIECIVPVPKNEGFYCIKFVSKLTIFTDSIAVRAISKVLKTLELRMTHPMLDVRV